MSSAALCWAPLVLLGLLKTLVGYNLRRGLFAQADWQPGILARCGTAIVQEPSWPGYSLRSTQIALPRRDSFECAPFAWPFFLLPSRAVPRSHVHGGARDYLALAVIKPGMGSGWATFATSARVFAEPLRKGGCPNAFAQRWRAAPVQQAKRLAWAYSMTSSARASTVLGTSMPSDFAVLRLMMRSNLAARMGSGWGCTADLRMIFLLVSSHWRGAPFSGCCAGTDETRAGKYLATTDGSSWAMALSERRVQISSIPRSGIPR